MEHLGVPPEVKDELAALWEGAEDRYTGLQLHFLRRLNRLLRLRQEQKAHLKAEGLRLLDRAIFSTYRDCVAAGLSNEAQKVIQLAGSQASPGGSEN